MNTATNIVNQPTLLLHSQRGVAIDFKDLRVNDILLIGTQNTCYRFVITCEKEMLGKLSGDLRDSAFLQAVLIGSMVQHGESVQTKISRLEPQSHALFFVQQGDKILKVLTSLITSLCCIRAVEG